MKKWSHVRCRVYNLDRSEQAKKKGNELPTSKNPVQSQRGDVKRLLGKEGNPVKKNRRKGGKSNSTPWEKESEFGTGGTLLQKCTQTQGKHDAQEYQMELISTLLAHQCGVVRGRSRKETKSGKRRGGQMKTEIG